MSKIYFSEIPDAGDWIKENDSGIMNIILIPKRWWSIKDWKIALDFRKNFVAGFITKNA